MKKYVCSITFPYCFESCGDVEKLESFHILQVVEILMDDNMETVSFNTIRMSILKIW